MSDRPTPETDAEWDRLQMLPEGGYSSRPAGIKLSFGMAGLAAQLERQRDEARELARELRDALTSMEEYYRQHIIRGSLFLQVHAALTKAKEVLP